MEFTVNKSDLVRELNLSQGVVERKTTIPILANVLLEASGDRVQLTATDLELGIRCSCAAKVTKPGAGTVPVKRLLDYVRLLPDSSLTVKFLDNHWTSITCGRSRTRIAGMSKESYPELPAMPEKLASIPVGVLTALIARTIFSISSEESRFTLNGALLLLRDRSITMVATDGHRLALVETTEPVEGVAVAGAYRALVPRKAMGEILKLAGEAGDGASFEFAGDENHLFFRLDDRLLISRKLTGMFPDYERVLPKDAGEGLVLVRDEIRGAVERVGQFAEERSKAIRLRLGDGEFRVFSSLSETGESEESVPAEYNGPEVDVAFNAQYLLEFLRAVPEDQVKLYIRDAQSAGELQPGGEAGVYNYRYIVMPMKV
jgi:DNA polymerase III subunit beta